jgi:uncharacterized RDD family membrane protein YckC
VIDPQQVTGPPQGAAPAGFVRRVAATLVDMVVYCGLCALLAYPLSRHLDWPLAVNDPEAFLGSLTDPGLVAHAAGILGLWIALWWCYFAVSWGLAGATVGKWALGLRLVDHRGNAPIGLTRAVLRLAAYSVSSLTFALGHLLVALRHDRRALHDILAGTWIVTKKPKIVSGVAQDDEALPKVEQGRDD